MCLMWTVLYYTAGSLRIDGLVTYGLDRSTRTLRPVLKCRGPTASRRALYELDRRRLARCGELCLNLFITLRITVRLRMIRSGGMIGLSWTMVYGWVIRMTPGVRRLTARGWSPFTCLSPTLTRTGPTIT